MTTFANVSDVSTRLGRPITSEAEVAQVNAWLSDAEALIRGRILDLDERVAAAPAYEDAVVSVEANAVVRKIQNPEGLRQTTRSVDDGSITKTRDSVLSDGQLRITDEEWALLLGVDDVGAFSTRPGFEPDAPAFCPGGWFW